MRRFAWAVAPPLLALPLLVWYDGSRFTQTCVCFMSLAAMLVLMIWALLMAGEG